MNIAKALTNAVVTLNAKFRENHHLKLKSGKVRFGRSPSLSYVFERQIASELSRIYPDYLFLVDYPISLYDSNQTHIGTVYIDIAVIDGIDIKKGNTIGTLVGILDLKIDLGYADLESYGYDVKTQRKISTKSEFSEREKLIRKARTFKFNHVVNAHSEEEKEKNKDIGKLEVKIPPKFKKIAIVCSKHNDHGRSGLYSEALRENGYKPLFLLNEDCHPNRLDDLSGEIRGQIMSKSKKINSTLSL